LRASTTNLFASSSLAAKIASSTADSLSTNTSFIEKIANKVVEMLQSTGTWVADRMTAKIALVDVVQANTISAGSITATSSVTVGTQAKPTGVTIFDKANGDAYCLNLINGALVPSKGSCDTQAPLIFPTPAPYIPDISNGVPQTPGTTTIIVATTTPPTNTGTSTPAIGTGGTATSTPPTGTTTPSTNTTTTTPAQFLKQQ
jgi:hypothetical protein